jgi:uncharacterized membrane protein SpoIIM required for sporulation
MILALGAAGLFILWSIYKLLIDKKTTPKDKNDIKLGYVALLIFAAIYYFLFY